MNTLKAIINIKNFNQFNVEEIYFNLNTITGNSIQNVGIALEYFIKDAYANSFEISDKEELYFKYFSYLGNKNNPPDAILSRGDAIEVKKVNSPENNIQLNSSFPKNKLNVNDPLLTNKCKECEEWTRKDIVYTIGIFNKAVLKSLFFVYGDCFAANESVYLNLKERITDVIYQFPKSELTKELGRINTVDPLNITKLRIRGMWLIDNPYNIFKDILQYEESNEFSLYLLVLKEKYESFPIKDRNIIKEDKDIEVKPIKIKDPNNTNQNLEAILLRYNI